MVDTKKTGDAARLVDTLEDAEHKSLEAVRKFLDTVNDAFPDFGGGEDGPRRRIIDSAFKMTENLVGASNHLAQNFLDLTEQRLSEPDKKAPAKKAPAKKASAKKAPARKAPARKASAK